MPVGWRKLSVCKLVVVMGMEVVGHTMKVVGRSDGGCVHVSVAVVVEVSVLVAVVS